MGEDIFPPGWQYPPANAYDSVWTVALGLNSSLQELWPQRLEDYHYKNWNWSRIFFNNTAQLNFIGVSVSEM